MKVATQVAVLLVLALLGWGAPAQAASETNSLKTREFRVDQSAAAARQAPAQSLRCWQVERGNWNGQSLAGLTLVLVQTAAGDGRGVGLAMYISDFATPAQREAMVAAIKAAYPMLFSGPGSAEVRVEPALIQVEQIDAGTILLHLALVA